MISIYLTDRQQYVVTKDSKSDIKILKTGVPQCSQLGPSPFLIYINGLPRCIKKSFITLFADGTSVYNLGTNATNELSEDFVELRK